MDPKDIFFIGIDFESGFIRGTIVDADLEVILKVKLDSPEDKDTAQCIQEIQDVINGLCEQMGQDFKKVKALGFATPGMVDTDNGMVLNAVNIIGWKDVNVSNMLKQRLRVPNRVLQNNVVRAYMEYCKYKPDYPKSLFYLNADSGVGGCFIKNHKFFLGDTFSAMEIGHTVVNPDGRLCHCGNHGCLEAEVGLNAIRHKLKQKMEIPEVPDMSWEDGVIIAFDQALKNGHPDAVALADEIVGYLSTALTNIIFLLNPSVVIIGGRLTRLKDHLFHRIHEAVHEHSLKNSFNEMIMRFSNLQEESTAIGAASLTYQLLRKQKKLTEINLDN